jgi:hypothetical protein
MCAARTGACLPVTARALLGGYTRGWIFRDRGCEQKQLSKGMKAWACMHAVNNVACQSDLDRHAGGREHAEVGILLDA